MRKLADGVWLLDGFPRHMFNVYLVGDVLVDAATRWARHRILRQLKTPPRLLALTHCHPDHQGSAAFLCSHFGIPLACHEADVPAMEGRSPMQPDNGWLRLGTRIWAGAAREVNWRLTEGDEVAGFRVIHAPGHTPGHIFLFRPRDRVVLAGDVLANISFLTGKPGLRLPPRSFSVSLEQNRQSLQKLVALEPALVCFGHGPPLEDMTKLNRLVAAINCQAGQQPATMQRTISSP